MEVRTQRGVARYPIRVAVFSFLTPFWCYSKKYSAKKEALEHEMVLSLGKQGNGVQISAFMEALHVAERLKNATRHCDTSAGRRESVAEHSWRLTLMAYFVYDEFPGIDLEKLLKMCLIHDLGEAFTGDIPTFQKTEADEARESAQLSGWMQALPEPFTSEMTALFAEMEQLQSTEARVYKALDRLEALIQHNEADLSSWLPLEYDLQMTYGFDNAAFSDYLTQLRERVRSDSCAKIASSIASVAKKDEESL